MVIKVSEKIILFFNVLFLSNLTLFSKILILVVLIFSNSKSFREAILEVNKVLS